MPKDAAFWAILRGSQYAFWNLSGSLFVTFILSLLIWSMNSELCFTRSQIMYTFCRILLAIWSLQNVIMNIDEKIDEKIAMYICFRTNTVNETSYFIKTPCLLYYNCRIKIVKLKETYLSMAAYLLFVFHCVYKVKQSFFFLVCFHVSCINTQEYSREKLCYKTISVGFQIYRSREIHRTERSNLILFI